jgi:hypothetical protein
MWDARNRSEAEALTGLAGMLAQARPDMAASAEAVRAAVMAALEAPTPLQVERGFEAAGRRLRAGWLRAVAAETARIPRSPTEDDMERLARSRHDAYGYERDFQPDSLEARCEAFFGPPPPGWSAAHVLFSSGQAALGAILLHLAEPRRAKLRVAHVGAYFETRELVARACTPVEEAADADCIIVEPIACDGRFSRHDPAAVARGLTGGQTLVIDETLSAPRTRSPAVLGEGVAEGAAILRLVSGLKLLQQGLELANVGVVSVFATDASLTRSLAEGLKRCRTLTGTGLRFVDALALEAPFFLDRAVTRTYAEAVFAHNAALAREVAARNRLFKPLDGADAGLAAPYCAFELADGNSVEALQALAGRIERQAQARGLLIERGGSFGFRGHRFEVIEPETGETPFLRVALGARDDRSCAGVIELMTQIAADGVD